MKIGILTHQYINNFGAFLQAYALQETLCCLFPEEEVYIIDCVNPKHFIINTGGWFRFYKNRENVSCWLQKIRLPLTFAKARKRYMHLTKRCYDAKGIEKLGLSCIVVGSDEVWNYRESKGNAAVKFGIGLDAETLVAYAPSVGQTDGGAVPDYVKNGIRKFKAVSARDDLTEKLAERIWKEPVTRVLDPTFLADIPDEPVKSVKKPYLLFYYCDRFPTAEKKKLLQYAQEKGMAVYGAGECDKAYTSVTVNLTPFQWVWMFRNASYVLTGTFHGAVFSMLNHRQFACYLTNPSRIKKVTSLLEEFGLTDRCCKDTAGEVIQTLNRKIDYKAMEVVFEKRRQESLDFLKRAIASPESAKNRENRQKVQKNAVLYAEKKDCCACGACVNACPVQAIVMQEDACGFWYPQVEETKCISCGACRRACAYQKPTSLREPLQTFAAANRNREQLLKSASGGVFAALATYVLKKGGAAAGAALVFENGKAVPRHMVIEDAKDLPLLQGSKYVQSAMGYTYREIKACLKTGRTVLFSGTPCQVAGLYGYLGKDPENLITADIVCHGVPNARFFNDYLETERKKRRARAITGYSFRDKKRGWDMKNARMDLKMETGAEKSVYIPARLNSYNALFLDGEIHRENCYSCRYAGKRRAGDLTIGDYWGIEAAHPELLGKNGYVEKDGISCVLANTPKGVRLCEEAGSLLQMDPSTFEKISRRNGQLVRPSVCSKKRKEILRLYRENGYPAVERWFRKNYRKQLLIHGVYNAIPRGLRVRLKALIKKN